MCEVEPRRRSCKSWRNPLLMASAMTSEATPAATPRTEMAAMMPMKAWRRLARKYRIATKSSKRMGGESCQHSAISLFGLYEFGEYSRGKWSTFAFETWMKQGLFASGKSLEKSDHCYAATNATAR